MLKRALLAAALAVLACPSGWSIDAAAPAARPFGPAPASVMISVAAPLKALTNQPISTLSLDTLAPLYRGLEAEGLTQEKLGGLPRTEADEAVARALSRARVSVAAYAETLAARAAADPAAAAQLEKAAAVYGPLLTAEGRSRVAALAAAARDGKTMDSAVRTADALGTSKEDDAVRALGAALAESNDYELGWSRVSELRRIAATSRSEQTQLAAIRALGAEAGRVSNRTYARHALAMLTDAGVFSTSARVKEAALSAITLERTAMLGKDYAAEVRASEAKVLASLEAAQARTLPPFPPTRVQKEGDTAKRSKTGMMIFMAVVIAHWMEHIFQTAQVWLLHWPRAKAGGLLGLYYPWLVHSEVLHYGYALAMLIGLVKLRGMFRGNAAKWWKLALGIQIWHHFEHLLLITQATLGHFPPTSIIQLLVPRIELHMFYNTAVTIPMVVALWQQRRLLRGEKTGKWPQILGAVLMVIALTWMIVAAIYSPDMPHHPGMMMDMPGMR